MSITDSLRKAFDDCTVMAGVEDKFECVYITKAAATKLLDEVDEAIDAMLGDSDATATRQGVGTCHEAAFCSCSECGAQLDGIYGHYCPNCGRRVVEVDE